MLPPDVGLSAEVLAMARAAYFAARKGLRNVWSDLCQNYHGWVRLHCATGLDERPRPHSRGVPPPPPFPTKLDQQGGHLPKSVYSQRFHKVLLRDIRK